MLNIRKNFYKSFHFRVIFVSVFILAVLVLIYLKFWRNESDSNLSELNKVEIKNDTSRIISADQQNIFQFLDKGIDSVLSGFGIKKEWITTTTFGSKPVKSKTEKPKKNVNSPQLFTKIVLIPKDLTSAEVNLDLSNLIKSAGLFSIVIEDIKTTDIDISVYKDSTSLNSSPLAKVSVSHTDKISRESGLLVVILSNLGDMKKEQVDEILGSTTEFSFVLPRNLEDIELQNKLIHQKKDLIINISVGDKESVESDFWIGMQEKEIKQKVKSFNVDFPSVKYVLLSTSDLNVQRDKLYSSLNEEFAKFDIKTIADSSIFKFPDVELSSSKIPSIISTLKARSNTAGKVITVLSMDYDTYKTFYSEMLTLKKQGYKFYNFSQYLTKEADKQKREKLLKEKQDDESKKKKTVKTTDKKPVKKTPVEPKNKKNDTKKKETTIKKK